VPLDISDLVKKTNDILNGAKQTMANVQDSSDHFRDISAKIDRGEGTMGALINNKKIYEELNQTTAQAKLGATALQENMEALKHNFLLRGFFNRRGYEDSAKLTENEIPELPKGQILKKFIYDPKKVFDKTDTAKLKNEKSLGDARDFMESNPFGAAVVVVSAGMKGRRRRSRTDPRRGQWLYAITSRRISNWMTSSSDDGGRKGPTDAERHGPYRDRHFSPGNWVPKGTLSPITPWT
jgi:hypothetical protein